MIEDEFNYGDAYLLKTEDQRYPIEIFKNLIQSEPGMYITSEEPSDLSYRHDLHGISFVWLSDQDHRSAIGPDEINLLGLAIKRFISQKEGVVLFDGLDYLLKHNPANTVVKFINSIERQIDKHSSLLLLVLDRSRLQKKDIDILTENLSFKIKHLGPKAQRRKGKIDTEDRSLVLEVREIIDFLEEQEKNLMEDKSHKNLMDTLKDEGSNIKSVKNAIEELREENRALKNELKKMKIQDREKIDEKSSMESKIVEDVRTTIDDEKKGIQEQVEKIGKSKKKKTNEKYEKESASDFMGTLLDLKEEVNSLRKEVKEIKSSDPQVDDITEKEVKKDDLEEKVLEEGKFKEDLAISDERGLIQEEGRLKIKADSVVDDDILSENDIEIGRRANIKGSIESQNDVKLEENAIVEGNIVSKTGEVRIGENCEIKGEIIGNRIVISSGSEVKEIKAEKEVILEKNTSALEVYCQGDIKISKDVYIDRDIYYGGKLIVEGSDTSIKEKAKRIEGIKRSEKDRDKQESIVEERWASEKNN